MQNADTDHSVILVEFQHSIDIPFKSNLMFENITFKYLFINTIDTGSGKTVFFFYSELYTETFIS